MNVEILDPAGSELADAFRHCEAQEIGLGARFEDQFKSTLWSIIIGSRTTGPTGTERRTCS